MRRFLTLMAFMLAAGRSVFAQDQSFFTLAGGDVGGNYFATARAICAEVNHSLKGEMRCSPEATPGSVYNLAGLATGQIDFAIVQSDWLSAARDGLGAFEGNGPMGDLRGVMPLYQEQFTLIAAKDAPISGVLGLTGMRVDLGPPASGRRASAENLFGQIGMKTDAFRQLSELGVSAAVDELCAGRLDAIVLVTGHPDFFVRRALGECGAKLVPLENSQYEKQIEAAGLYAKSAIMAGTYGATVPAISTYSVTATLVTRRPVDAQVDRRVVAIVNSVRDAQASLSRRVAVLAGLNANVKWSDSLGVTAHPDIPSVRSR
jgi:uncharacterized protein